MRHKPTTHKTWLEDCCEVSVSKRRTSEEVDSPRAKQNMQAPHQAAIVRSGHGFFGNYCGQLGGPFESFVRGFQEGWVAPASTRPGMQKGPSTNVVRTLGVYARISYYGWGQVRLS